ncbi:hypothetical protein [Mycoavidus cysteinexigens]|nr:hypothetical protein [Mycoavidus cysteinexigens]
MSRTEPNLPPRMSARVQRSGQTYYYYDTGHSSRQVIALGADYLEALQKWSELDSQNQSRVFVQWCRRRHVKFDGPHRGLKGAQDDWDHLNEPFK